LVILVCVAQRGFAWGREGHEVVALIAGHYMTGAAKAKTTALLDGSSIEAVASWADDYRRDHRETAPWHLINSPLTHYRIVLVRDCPSGQCVVAKTQDYLSVLRDPTASRAAKAEALKFVVHFVGDLHQPLHDDLTYEIIAAADESNRASFCTAMRFGSTD
jgi:hypothetical protein